MSYCDIFVPVICFSLFGNKKRTGGTALCVGFIAEELKPQGICLSCILGITVAV